MLRHFDFKTYCDICLRPFTSSDVATLNAVARLNSFGGSESTWVLVGFGSGIGEKFVHSACLVGKGRRVLRGLSDADQLEVDPGATEDDQGA